MRVAITYRPKGSAPPEMLPMLMEALGQWVEGWSGRVEVMEFFVVGGGLVVAELADAGEVHQLVVENPFTAYMDVEIMPVVEPRAAMATYGEMAAGLAAGAPTVV